MIRTGIVLVAILVTIGLAVNASRQARKQALQDAVEGIPSELPTEVLTTLRADDHIIGSPDAPVVIVEFSDLECPFCMKAHPILKSTIKKFDGKVAWVYRHYPLPNHKGAAPKALVTECVAQVAGNEGFWKAIDGYMSGLETKDILKKLDLTTEDLADCVVDPKTEQRVQEDITLATKAKTTGTPNFVIMGPNGVQIQLPGQPKAETLEVIITQLLATQK